MKLKKLSLRFRIFIAMILVVLLASILIAAVSIYQYNEEAQDYHRDRLERKESAIKEHINYILSGRQNTYVVSTDNIPLIFKEKIYEISAIHELQVNLYDLDGGLLKSSKANITADSISTCLDAEILNRISNTADHRYIRKNTKDGKVFQSSYYYSYRQQI